MRCGGACNRLRNVWRFPGWFGGGVPVGGGVMMILPTHGRALPHGGGRQEALLPRHWRGCVVLMQRQLPVAQGALRGALVRTQRRWL